MDKLEKVYYDCICMALAVGGLWSEYLLATNLTIKAVYVHDLLAGKKSLILKSHTPS